MTTTPTTDDARKRHLRRLLAIVGDPTRPERTRAKALVRLVDEVGVAALEESLLDALARRGERQTRKDN